MNGKFRTIIITVGVDHKILYIVEPIPLHKRLPLLENFGV